MSQSICSTGLRWLWLVVVVLIIDLGSKYLILQNFALGIRSRCSRRLICIMRVTMAQRLVSFADSGGWQRWFFCRYCDWY